MNTFREGFDNFKTIFITQWSIGKLFGGMCKY